MPLARVTSKKYRAARSSRLGARGTVRRLIEEYLKRELRGLRPDAAPDYIRDWIDPVFLDELAIGTSELARFNRRTRYCK